MVVDMLQPGVVGIPQWRHSEAPAGVLAEQLSAPFLDVEGWVGEDRGEAGVRQGVLQQGALIVPADVAGDPSDGEVHPGEPVGLRVALLPVDRDVINPPRLGFHESVRLDVESASAAARIVDAAFERLDHLHHQGDDGARRVLLPSRLALHGGKLAEEELVDPAEQVEVFRRTGEIEVGEVVDQPAEHLGAEVRLAEDLRQHALERVVVALDCPHRVVEPLPDVRGTGVGLEG